MADFASQESPYIKYLTNCKIIYHNKDKGAEQNHLIIIQRTNSALRNCKVLVGLDF